MSESSRVVVVSGHVFGLRAFEGIFASKAFIGGRIDIPLMIELDPGRATTTVGYRALATLASEQDVRCVSTSDGRLRSLAGLIRECEPHYLLIIGWSSLVANEVLAIPHDRNAHEDDSDRTFRSGCIGMHPTKLPVGRGQAPIPWTIIKGVKNTALSVFGLEIGADTGPIIAQYDVTVHPRETSASLFYRMANMHFVAGMDLAPGLASRDIIARPQDSSVATVWPRRRPADGEIRAEMTYTQIDRLVRGLLGPYPRAFVVVGDRRYTVASAELLSCLPIQEPREAGHMTTRYLHFACSDGTVRLRVADNRIERDG
jgi:methionyl-tRNA formyltransferase